VAVAKDGTSIQGPLRTHGRLNHGRRRKVDSWPRAGAAAAAAARRQRASRVILGEEAALENGGTWPQLLVASVCSAVA
jgi:hypothetical protein